MDPVTQGWVPRGDCGPWTPALVRVYETANASIFAAYMLIAAILAYAVLFEHRGGRSRAELSEKDRFVMRATYAGFIGSCGIGHLEGVVSFFWPHYPAFAAWHVLTAAWSWLAVVVTARYREKLIVGL